MKKKRIGLSEKTWFVILLLVIFPPVGIFLMWKKGKFTRTIRIITSLVTGSLFVATGSLVLYFGMWLYLIHAYMPHLEAFQ